MADSPRGGKPPRNSGFWMDWFNYFLGLGYRWEEAARLSWNVIEDRNEARRRLAADGREPAPARAAPPKSRPTTQFERCIARWTEDAAASRAHLRLRTPPPGSPWAGQGRHAGWKPAGPKDRVNLMLRLDVAADEDVDAAVDTVLREPRVRSGLAALVTTAQTKGFDRAGPEREVVKTLIRTALSRAIRSDVSHVRLNAVPDNGLAAGTAKVRSRGIRDLPD